MTWFKRLWRNKQMEEKLDQELQFHLEEQANELVKRGYEPHEARRQAIVALGGPEQLKEECRDVRGTRWLQDFVQDFRYAIRSMRQRPGFALVALLTLGLGTGATTVMFSIINGVLLKPFPYPQPDRLLTLHEQTEQVTGQGLGRIWFSYPNFVDCSRQSRTLSIAAHRYNSGVVSGHGDPQYVNGMEVSPNLFSVLGIPLLLGRSFLPEEDRLGGAPAAILSYDLWQRYYQGSADAIGKPIVFAERSYTIVGIAPPGFRVDGQQIDMFTPIGQDTSPGMQNRDLHPGIAVDARLAPGVTLAQAQSELSVIGRQLAEQYPKHNRGSRTFIAEQLKPDVGDVRGTLWLLLGAVSLLLLIACVNVASLLLARAVSRERELAMRAALGASRSRLVRQCLAESIVLGLAGSALGVLLAALGLRPFVTFWPGSLPRAEEVHLDWNVLLCALGVSLLSGLLFGLAPALRVPSRNIDRILRAGMRSVTGRSRHIHAALVIAEIALAGVLLVSAGMLGRTLIHLASLNPGVDVRNVLTARMAISATLTDPARIRAAWQDIADRAGNTPGVESVTTVDAVPMLEANNTIGYWTTADMPPADKQPLALAYSVTPDYLKVMGIPLLKGRFLAESDRKGSEPVAVIDDVLAQQAFGGEEAIGLKLWLPSDSSFPLSAGTTGPESVTVVGVVGHVRYWGLDSDDQAVVRAQLYYPFAQVADPYVPRWSERMSIAVRTKVAPMRVVDSLRQELRGPAGDQALYQVNTMEQLVSSSLARQRFLLLLFSIFAGLALILGCVGIYGVLAYLTNQRVPEIGLRMALGATASEVVKLVFRQSLVMIAAGIGVAAAGAIGAERLMEDLIPGMQPGSPLTFAAMLLVLVVAAMLASFLPARRASRVDPAVPLRQD